MLLMEQVELIVEPGQGKRMDTCLNPVRFEADVSQKGTAREGRMRFSSFADGHLVRQSSMRWE